MVDFDKKNLIESDYLHTSPMSVRRLKSSNSKAVQLYLSEAKTKIDDNKIVPKIRKNISTWDYLSCSSRITALDRMDNQLHQILLSFEKICRKIRAGLVSCSPELSTLGLT